MKRYKLPIVIFFIGILVAMGRYIILTNYQSEFIKSKIAANSTALKNEIALSLDFRIRSLERMAQRLEANLKMSKEEWEGDAFALYRQLPGFYSLERVDTNRVIQWTYPLDETKAELQRALKSDKQINAILQETVTTGAEMIASPLMLSDSVFGFAIVFPIFANQEKFSGYLIGVFNADIFFNSVSPSNYLSITVSDGGKIIFTNENSDERSVGWMVVSAMSPLNKKWDISFNPSKSFIQKDRRKGPIVSAIICIVFFFLIALIVWEIQKRNAAEKLLVEEKRRLELKSLYNAKLASIGQVAAGIGHEINNPLTIVRGFAYKIRRYATLEHMKNSDVINEIAKAVDWQEDAIDRMVEIVGSLQTLAKMDVADPVTMDIHKVIKDTLELVESVYQNDNVAIELYLNATQCSVSGNIGKFQQVLMNLMSNAAYALKGTSCKKIQIETKTIDASLLLKISDNGCGIPEKNIARVFDPFFTTKPGGEGNGLGLGISYGIIKELDGSIEVRSELGKGTTFTISLPLEPTYESKQNKLTC